MWGVWKLLGHSLLEGVQRVECHLSGALLHAGWIYQYADLIEFRTESFCLQSWTGYLGQTLVFVWDGARGMGVYEGGGGGVNFYCKEFSASIDKISFLGVRMGASKVLSCLACCDATCIYQFITNNQVSFHLS